MSGTTRTFAAVALGAVLGLTNSVANVVGGPYSPHPLRPDGVWGLQLLGAVLGTTWAWAAGAFACGWLARRWWQGPLLGVAGMWSADLAYYVSDWLGGVTDQLALNEIQIWAVIGAAAGIGMGLLATLSRQREAWSICPVLLAAAVLWKSRQFSGADVVRHASHLTQTSLTLAILAGLVAWWALGRRPDLHRGPAVAESDDPAAEAG